VWENDGVRGARGSFALPTAAGATVNVSVFGY
jgi:hypothetical protein